MAITLNLDPVAALIIQIARFICAIAAPTTKSRAPLMKCGIDFSDMRI